MIKIKNKLVEYRHLVLSIILVLIPFLVFYPSHFTTIDEHDYINNAYLLFTEGSLKTDCSRNMDGQWNTGEYCISKYNIGTSLILLPAVLISKDLIAATTILVFIIAIVVFYKLLKLDNLDSRFIYLFALFPAFIFFSRTALSEIYSMTFLLVAFYLLRKASSSKILYYHLLSGVAVILIVFIRYTNAIPISILLGYFVYTELPELGIKKFLNKWIYLILLLFAGGALFLLFNYYHYGGLFRSGYYYSSEEGRIILEQIPVTFLKYFFLTNIFYPFTLILSFKSKVKFRKLLLSLFLSLFIFYTILKNESFSGKLTDLILGLRFLIPVYPFVLLAYFEILGRFAGNRYYKIVIYTITALLTIIAILINLIHFQFLNK